jgi:dienelactone hydrolase
MRTLQNLPLFLLTILIVLTSCNNNDKKTATSMKDPKLKEENVSYKLDSSIRNNFVVYDENVEGKRPAILVIHEWWGLNDYVKMRARELAKLGYIAMAVDMYGDGKMGNNPKEAGELATPFYTNPQKAKSIFDAAVKKLKEFNQTDTSKLAAIGYCFGGTQVLNIAKLGEDLKGVVSFHGGLAGVAANKDLLKAEILVCHGAADSFVPQNEVDKFRKQLDSINASYIFKSFEGATHAFTNPDATAMGEKFKMPIKYDALADTASWKEMKSFLSQIFK